MWTKKFTSTSSIAYFTASLVWIFLLYVILCFLITAAQVNNISRPKESTTLHGDYGRTTWPWSFWPSSSSLSPTSSSGSCASSPECWDACSRLVFPVFFSSQLGSEDFRVCSYNSESSRDEAYSLESSILGKLLEVACNDEGFDWIFTVNYTSPH